MGMWGGKGKGKGKGKNYGSFKIDESGGILGEFTGTIKSFSFRSGYGFIESADVKAMGHGDVWMHADMKKNLEVGATVKFTAFQNAKGQVQCKDVSAASLNSAPGEQNK